MNSFTEAELAQFFQKTIADELSVSIEEIKTDVEFLNFGLDSIRAIFILQHLEKFTGLELNPLLLWDHPTIESFSKYLVSNAGKN